ncbi:MAG: hypothetical protein HYX81_00465 [Chloroflexi bacterium]|nr:hypothetical protein [Chloroflexota bacterium]
MQRSPPALIADRQRHLPHHWYNRTSVPVAQINTWGMINEHEAHQKNRDGGHYAYPTGLDWTFVGMDKLVILGR